jgi:hypothetical protein
MTISREEYAVQAEEALKMGEDLGIALGLFT